MADEGHKHNMVSLMESQLYCLHGPIGVFIKYVLPAAYCAAAVYALTQPTCELAHYHIALIIFAVHHALTFTLMALHALDDSNNLVIGLVFFNFILGFAAVGYGCIQLFKGDEWEQELCNSVAHVQRIWLLVEVLSAFA